MVRENEQITAIKWQKKGLKMVVAGLQSFKHEITSGRNHTQILSFPKTVVPRKAKIQLRAKHFDSTMHEPVRVARILDPYAKPHRTREVHGHLL